MIPARVVVSMLATACCLVSCAAPDSTPESSGFESAGRVEAALEPSQSQAVPSDPEGLPEAPNAFSPDRVTRMPLGNLFALQQSGKVLLYDVRPAIFYRLGHIPGALSWPKSSFNAQIRQRENEILAARAAGKPVVLYCTDLACPDARNVAEMLAARGHAISVLEGGWEAWKAGELPTQ